MPRDDQQGKRGFERTPSTDKGQLPTGKSWFFGIGINEYRNFPNLRNARKDITDVLQLLQERYDLDEYRILFDEEATKDSIIDHLQELLESVQENDKLLIYYSGHGYLDRKDRGYWLPYDAQQKRVASYIRNSTLKEFLEDIEARHILLASDSCFSGALLVRDVSYAQAAMEEFERDRSRWVISSGRQREPVADGKPGQNSPFTSSILKILRKNQELKLNAALLFDQVTKLTRFQYDQTPQNAPLVGAGHEGGQYVFRLKAGEQAIWEACIEENTVAAFNRYLDRFPEGKYVKDAIIRLKDLEDDREWDRATRIDRIFAYRTYLSTFPRGRHVQAARERIKELEEEITVQEEVPISPPEPSRRPPTSKKSEPKPASKAPNTFTDPRDGRTYKTVELNGLVWMAENLNFDVGEGCWFYEDDPKNGEKYGRLYTWEAARKACPPGWRLPKMQEWVELEKLYRGQHDAFIGLTEGGESGFNVLLGGKGSENGRYSELGENGYYWTGKESNEKKAVDFRFKSREESINDYSDIKTFRFSCRCVRDLSTASNNEESLENQIFVEKKEGSEGSFVDPRDGQEYKTVVLNGLIWMADNLKFDAGEESWYISDDPNTCEIYGRLYTLKAAKKGCPPGWRLPTDEEWKSLSTTHGGYYDKLTGENIENPAAAYQELREKLNIQELPGYRNLEGKAGNIDYVASFWTSSISQKGNYFNYDFVIRARKLYRTFSPSGLGLSCRCVRDLNPSQEDVQIKEESKRENEYLEESEQETFSDTKLGVFIDPRDGQKYQTVEIDGKTWLAENLNYDVGGDCWYYDEDEKNKQDYGRLYTWEASKKACPPGWRLPSFEEWKQLMSSEGGYVILDQRKTEKGNPKRAFAALTERGKTRLNCQFGGWRNPNGVFSRIGGHGFYWSQSEKSSELAWDAIFDKEEKKVFLNSGNKMNGNSCRCIKEDELFIDPRDGQTYKTVELNGLVWMAENLNFDVGEGCWFYEDNPENGEKYGRLYTWEAARKACPPGWRLPTDAEWRAMAKKFGGCDVDANDGGEAAYEALIEGGRSNFKFQLGGWRGSNGKFLDLGDYGNYWSLTNYNFGSPFDQFGQLFNSAKGGAGNVWGFHFRRKGGILARSWNDISNGFSCRLIQPTGT